MGEYAAYQGQRIKIGTCEDMLYLRAGQAGLVVPLSGNINPNDTQERTIIRFRFPWPDEDGIAPGAFQDPFRSLGLYGLDVPAEIDHSTVQFVASVGYLVSLPCPESPAGKASGLPFARNGYAGPVKIVQQAWRDGKLVTICACGACGSPYRVPTLADAEPVIVALRRQADRSDRDESRAKWYHAVADRIATGYLPGLLTVIDGTA